MGAEVGDVVVGAGAEGRRVVACCGRRGGLCGCGGGEEEEGGGLEEGWEQHGG